MKNRSTTKLLSTCAIVAASAFWQGCAPMKTVTINSAPEGASLMLYKVSATGQETPLPLDPKQQQAPATVELNFADQAHYRVEAHHVLCLPSLDTTIAFDPQMAYTVNLTQYKAYVTGIENTPKMNGKIWQLVPTPKQTVASLDASEPSNYYITPPTPITHNKRTDLDYPAFTASPTAAAMVYEEITPDSSTSTGYSSKLWKLPLEAGENPSLLTLSHKQQRFPTYDFSGAEVIFDTDDDNVTDAPSYFKAVENEASISHMLSANNTLEYDFSVGQSNLAFAAFGPNSTEGHVDVADRNGAGITERDAGLSPQLSPDQSTIVYIHKPETTNNSGKYRIYTVNTRGPIMSRQLPINEEADNFDPHWSPDGKMIVFCSPSRGKDLPDDNKKEPNAKYHDAESEHSFIWLMSADGQHVIRLTRNESYDSNPVFDRNGRSIYFRSNRGGIWNIWKMDLMDSAFKELNVAPPGQ